MSETENSGDPIPPTPIEQPPYFVMTEASHSAYVQDVAEISAMRVAQQILTLGGGALPGDAEDPALTEDQKALRISFCKRVFQRNIDRYVLALLLIQAPDVAAAAYYWQSNYLLALSSVDLADAWRRNWTDYATLMAFSE